MYSILRVQAMKSWSQIYGLMNVPWTHVSKAILIFDMLMSWMSYSWYVRLVYVVSLKNELINVQKWWFYFMLALKFPIFLFLITFLMMFDDVIAWVWCPSHHWWATYAHEVIWWCGLDMRVQSNFWFSMIFFHVWLPHRLGFPIMWLVWLGNVLMMYNRLS